VDQQGVRVVLDAQAVPRVRLLVQAPNGPAGLRLGGAVGDERGPRAPTGGRSSRRCHQESSSGGGGQHGKLHPVQGSMLRRIEGAQEAAFQVGPGAGQVTTIARNCNRFYTDVIGSLARGCCARRTR
jgi:hypothetical protein